MAEVDEELSQCPSAPYSSFSAMFGNRFYDFERFGTQPAVPYIRVCAAVRAYTHLLVGQNLDTIFSDFGAFWHKLVHEQQLRWLGPEKGVTHMAVGAILNALWDLWAKLEGKPLWKLLSDMTPEELCSVIPFGHITNALTKAEALNILQQNNDSKSERVKYLLENGLPAYITSAGWLGYSDAEIAQRCKDALQKGWRTFKMKVGVNLDDDIRRARVIRETIGDECKLMMDANQVWEVQQAIEWMKKLAQFKPTWIEEPTSPDDIIGHQQIEQALKPLNIGIATGEHCCNRVVFKQLMQCSALDFCQIDACRMASVNEILSVLLMAAKFKGSNFEAFLMNTCQSDEALCFSVPVCPHAGGVGLCELVPHLSAINYIAVAPTLQNVFVEYADHLHEHFVHPAQVKSGCYIVPKAAGYSCEMLEGTIPMFEYPHGSVWQKRLAK